MELLVFERVESEHLSKMFKWRNDHSIYKWCRQSAPISWETHENWFERQDEDPSIEMFAMMAETIRVKTGLSDANLKRPFLVGCCGLTSIDYINSRAEFSLYIGPEFQGRGYGRMALKELFRYAFEVYNLNLVWGESIEANPAMKIFEEAGMKKEGTRHSFYYKEGRYLDAKLFSINKHEFEESK